jgi:regulatory protein YycI of two-component signal transduction system YycFG
MKKVLGLLLFALVGISLMGCEIESTPIQDSQKPVDLSSYVTAELTDNLTVKLDVKFDAIQKEYPYIITYTHKIVSNKVISVLFYNEHAEVVGYANTTFKTSSL